MAVEKEVKQSIAGDTALVGFFFHTQSSWMDPASGQFSLKKEHSAAFLLKLGYFFYQMKVSLVKLGVSSETTP